MKLRLGNNQRLQNSLKISLGFKTRANLILEADFAAQTDAWYNYKSDKNKNFSFP